MRPTSRIIAFAFIAAVAVICSLRRYSADLASPYTFEPDARHHVWWTYRFADPGLFEGDLVAEYYSGTFTPIGYRALARIFVPIIDAQTYSEIVPFVITALLVVLAILLGLKVSGGSWLGATAAVAFVLGGGVLPRVAGGLPRAWAMPVLLFGLWAVLGKRLAWFGGALVAAAVFYPPLLVNLGLVGGTVFAIDVARTRRLPRNWIVLAGLGMVALLTVVVESRSPTPDTMGPKVTAEVARTMPEFGPDGRSKFFVPDPVDYYIISRRSGLGFSEFEVLIVCAGATLGAWLLPGTVPLTVWLLAASAFAGYVAAHATLFTLHLPNRYAGFGLRAFTMLWLAAVLPAGLARMKALRPVARACAFLERPNVILPLLLVVVAGLATEALVHVRRELAEKPAPGYAELMTFLSGLPKDALIAAHPGDASSIPLLTKRSVLASQETSVSYDLGYYGTMKGRIFAQLEACYSTDWSNVDRLSREFGVDVFVVDLARYTRPVDLRCVYFEPFRSAVRDLVELGQKKGFALENPPSDRVLFRSGNFLAVRVKAGD